MSDPQGEPERAARVPLGGDLIIPLLACGLAAYYFASTVDLVWEAKATGLVVGIVLVMLCVAHFARVGRRVVSGAASLGLGELIAPTTFNKQRLALIALAALFIVSLPWVGTTL